MLFFITDMCLLQLFTIELGGQKIVVVSSYEVMHELLVKNADFSSNRTVRTMPNHYEEIAKHTPGELFCGYWHLYIDEDICIFQDRMGRYAFCL